jgi:H+/Cl- antiporter ClcA
VLLFIKVAAAGIAFGWCGRFFVAATHGIKEKMAIAIPRHQWLIPVIGGVVIIALSQLPGNTDYLGLGVTSAQPRGVSIVGAFGTGGAHTFSWLWKLVFTAITLGTGFKGGEVTPLFFMGATLGNVLAGYVGAPTDLMAGLGFIAVFASAANTPLACMLMGAELFGTQHLLYYATACIAAYYSSGHKGIYSAQRIHQHKFGRLKKGK